MKVTHASTHLILRCWWCPSNFICSKCCLNLNSSTKGWSYAKQQLPPNRYDRDVETTNHQLKYWNRPSLWVTMWIHILDSQRTPPIANPIISRVGYSTDELVFPHQRQRHNLQSSLNVIGHHLYDIAEINHNNNKNNCWRGNMTIWVWQS
jgi:hypothetical protein